MSIKAALDIGTNSVRLLIAAQQDGAIKSLCKELRTTRLGEGVHNSGCLSAEAMTRTVEAVTELAGLARYYQADKIAAVATSAVRDAANGKEFTQQCFQKAGVQVEILSGLAEGKLSFAGAVMDQSGRGDMLVIDIGGGSTELAFGRDKQLIRANSLNLGAVRLKDLFPPSYNGIIESLTDIQDYIGLALRTVSPVTDKVNLIGVGGTVTSLAAVDQQLAVYDSDKVHGYFLSSQCVSGMLSKFASMPLNERKCLAGLQPVRADIIVYGAAILACLLDWYGSEGITVSERDILEGIIIELYSR